MSQTRWRPSLLNAGNYSSPKEHVLDMTTLDGGLNLWELDYKLDPNQSPDTLNMYWKDGSLMSRQGQEYLYEATLNDPFGDFYAGYKRLWSNRWICHKGTKLYAVDITNGTHMTIYSGSLTPTAGGTFFVFGDNLYYMNGHEYIRITPGLVASDVIPYIPTVLVNRTPSGIGGDTYEDENRIAAGKKIQFTADGTSTEYHLPYTELDASPAMTAIVNGTEMAEGSGFTVNRTTGVVTFSTAPSQTTPATPNNVEITCYKENVDAKNSIMSCTCITTYGSDRSMSVICGGPAAQPNAYFWSGNNSLGLDPSYFPFDYYNFAGNTDEYVTGFGKQQDMLVIFKERSIGKSKFSIETVNGMAYLKLPYTPVNDTVGCNIENSIRLIENNLVFANTESGVYVLLDTSAAGENNVLRISRNVNGDRTNKGLLHDLQSVASTGVTSYDDGHRYWITAAGHAYLWDYELHGYRTKEEKLTWFYFDNIRPLSWFSTENEHFYGRADGSLVKFVDAYHDFGEPMLRRYTFATQRFGTYDVLKDVVRVIFAVRSDTDTIMNITYKTDYETRDDLTPIRAWAWKLVPRNLSYRSLKVIPYALTAIRKPRCFHVRHFTMTIYNNELYSDMSLVSAQIVYRYSRGDR